MLTSHHDKCVVTLRNFKMKLNEIKEIFINHNSFCKRFSNNKSIFDDIFKRKFAKNDLMTFTL